MNNHATENPLARNLIGHIIQLVRSNAAFSDIHVEQNHPVVWRLPDGWQETGFGVATPQDMFALMNVIHKEWKTIFGKSIAINKTLNYPETRLRCSAYSTNGGGNFAVTIRALPVKPPTLEQLRLPAQVGQFASVPKGILLVAGATGSGKTTTIAALTSKINELRQAHIVTIEEPIEIVYERQKSVITQREVGEQLDVKSFAQGVNEALRQCPDVIVIGEIRDQETAEAAFRGAESGHYVMATVHAKNALGAVQKMLSFFPEDMRAAKAATIANTLCGVIFQSIMPAVNENRFVVAAEILTGVEDELASALIDPARFRQLGERLKSGQLSGCIHLNATLKKMVSDGLVSIKAARAASYLPGDLI